MNYTITPVSAGPFTRYQLRRGAEFIGEFPNLATCEAMRDASDAAGSDDFVRGYIECLYFTDTGEDGQPASDAELSDEAREAIRDECEQYQRENSALLAQAYATGEYDAAQAGRDFHFTRNGHGVGFWDRDSLDVPVAGVLNRTIGELLSESARKCEETHVYAGNDGLIYID